MKKAFLSSLIICAVSFTIFPQDMHMGKLGIGIDGVNSPNLAAKYYFTPKIAGELTVGFNLYSPGGDTPVSQTKVTGTDIRVAAACLYHFSVGEFKPYFGIEAGYENIKQGGFYTVEPEAKGIVSANLILGGEYFLAKQFSVGIKEKIGMDFKLKRDIPKEENDFYLNTGTLVTARFYFN